MTRTTAATFTTLYCEGISGTPFTLDGLEESFHAFKRYDREMAVWAMNDSLDRAMKTAPEYYKGFCHAGKLTAAENELKLYNICRKAKATL